MNELQERAFNKHGVAAISVRRGEPVVIDLVSDEDTPMRTPKSTSRPNPPPVPGDDVIVISDDESVTMDDHPPLRSPTPEFKIGDIDIHSIPPPRARRAAYHRGVEPRLGRPHPYLPGRILHEGPGGPAYEDPFKRWDPKTVVWLKKRVKAEKERVTTRASICNPRAARPGSRATWMPPAVRTTIPGYVSPVTKFPAAVQRIAQVRDWIIAGSNTHGGNDRRDVDPYNKPNALQALHSDRMPLSFNDHSEVKNGAMGPVRKFGSINDIVICPQQSDEFVTSGGDGTVRWWKLSVLDTVPERRSENRRDAEMEALQARIQSRANNPDDDEENSQTGGDEEEDEDESDVLVNTRVRSGDYPRELLFRRDGSVLAVACQNGRVILLGQEQDRDHTPLPRKPGLPLCNTPIAWERGYVESSHSTLGHLSGARHTVGGMVWGQGSNANSLFTTTEMLEPPGVDGQRNHPIGRHAAFDAGRMKEAYVLDAQEEGDSVAYDTNSDTLALVTAGVSRISDFHLHLYDTRRKDRRRYTKRILLRPFTNRQDDDGEVTATAFSPDGLLLAFARNDNQTHVYDRRYLSSTRGPLLEFIHADPIHQENNGCVDAVWVQSSFGVSCGLVSGAADGCVRLWDVGTGKMSVLARVKDSIATFSVGKPGAGENSLVVGDSSGALYNFDRKANSTGW